MARVLFFAQARDAAGVRSAELEGSTVSEVLAAATAAYGAHLERVIGISALWVNGEPAEASTPVKPDDEVAILPPVSGGGR